MTKKKNGFIFSLFLLFAINSPFNGFAALAVKIDDNKYPFVQEGDSISSYIIDEVTVTGNQSGLKFKNASPVQILEGKSISETNSLSVSEAVRFFSGATIKDYGGIGGMKTLSIRSLGAAHTAVAYDGITITDSQTGQIDLGRYTLDNVELLSLNIGDGNDIFQPARMFASSGLLSIKTRKPAFDKNKKQNLGLGIKTGSFGLINPDLKFDYKLTDKLSFRLSAEALKNKGDYPYKLYYSDSDGLYSNVIRTNNNVSMYKVESTFFADFDENTKLEVKGYYYNSSKDLPGAVILYNPYSGQHLWDRNGFMQGHFLKNFNKRLSLQINAKYNAAWQRYLDPDYLGSEGVEDNTYRQDEYYVSSAVLYKMTENLSLAVSADAAVSKMISDMYEFVNPYRNTFLTNISAKYENKVLLATVGLLGTFINEETMVAKPAKDLNRISPSFNFSVRPFEDIPARIRFFYKESFRTPSFNDLYYSAVGNLNLRPEENSQIDLGINAIKAFDKTETELMFTADVFRNVVKDKIQAMPTKNIFIWSMVNLGRVEITGLDLGLELKQKLSSRYSLSAGLSHSYQRALDKTDKSRPEYNNQIAYAPRVYGAGRLSFYSPYGRLSYALVWSGHRYVTGHNLVENNLEGYADHSVSFEKPMKIFGSNIDIKAELLNLMNNNYEIVRNFPMPGLSFRLGFKIDLL